jgi:TM2 domain-containing membrane protein YozV
VLGLSEPLVLDSAQEPSEPVELSAPAPLLAAAPPLPPPAATVAAPPPPRGTSAVPPPPLPSGGRVSTLGATRGYAQPSLAEMYATFDPPKSRVTFVLLGVFFGALGVHNFYAGYVRKAVAQLCLTLFTFFYGSFISWIWAVIEVCIVKQDNEGVPFS